MELEIVNELKYVEIEVTDTDGSAKDIKAGLTQFVKALNLDPLKKDSRSWVEIINGKITYNDFREVTAMFNTDSKKYSYFSLRDDYILLNGKNDIVDDFDFEKDYLNKLKK